MSLHSPEEVRRQVWHSLVSMLQVYAHAASLNGRSFSVTSNASETVVRHEDAVLTVSMDAATGRASWRSVRPGREEHGGFTIDPHGALNFPSGEKELDAAAIDWMDHLAQPEPVKS